MAGRHANVAQVAGAVARRDVHAAAQGDGRVGEVAAHPAAFLQRLPRTLGGVGELVAEGHVGVHVVADRLHPGPPGRGTAEQVPGLGHQLVGLAVAAAQQVHQGFIGQLVHGHLLRVHYHRVGPAAVCDHRIGEQGERAGRRHQAGAHIAEAIVVLVQRHLGAGAQLLADDQVGATRVVQVEGHQHGGRFDETVGDLVTQSNQHAKLRMRVTVRHS